MLKIRIRLIVIAAPLVLSVFSLFLRVPAALAKVIVASSTIQIAVDAADPGDTILIPAGVHHEAVLVKNSNLTLKGAPGAILDGTGLGNVSGIRVQADSGTISGFTLIGTQIRNYSRDGIFLRGVDNFKITGGVFSNDATYGIFPVLSSHGSIEGNIVSGAQDTGIYVGQSSNVEVRRNRSHGNTIGIEVELSDNIDVRDNLVGGNAIGIFVQVSPGELATTTTNVEVANNLVLANNLPNPSTDPNDLLTLIPGGVGVLNVGGDNVTIEHNSVLGNNTGGIAVVQLPPVAAALDPRIDPFPDDGIVRDNIVLFNARHPDPKIAALGLPAVDLLWDLSGTDNCWSGNLFGSFFPASFPSCF